MFHFTINRHKFVLLKVQKHRFCVGVVYYAVVKVIEHSLMNYFYIL